MSSDSFLLKIVNNNPVLIPSKRSKLNGRKSSFCIEVNEQIRVNET